MRKRQFDQFQSKASQHQHNTLLLDVSMTHRYSFRRKLWKMIDVLKYLDMISLRRLITQEQSTQPWVEGNTNTINATKCPPMQDADTAHLLKLVSIQDNEAILVVVGKPPDNFTLGLRFVVYHNGKLCKRRWCNNRKEVRVGLTIQWTWQIKPTVRCIGRLTYVVEEGLSRCRGCFLLLRRRCLLHRCWFRFCWIIIIVARFVSW